MCPPIRDRAKSFAATSCGLKKCHSCQEPISGRSVEENRFRFPTPLCCAIMAEERTIKAAWRPFPRPLLYSMLFTNTPCYIGIMYEIPAFLRSRLGRKKEEPQWQ